MALPLEHIRVLDFGQYVAGPVAAMMLAEQGAEVIRIDLPGGPRWKSPAMDILNRRKKSIVLDLKTNEDLAITRNLIAAADVLIENFRPGVMSKPSLGPDKSHALNPRLIYVSFPGFASEDQEYAHIPAWEALIATASGQFTDMGLNRILMGINPSFSPVTLASVYAALLGATAVSSALYTREEHGHGDYIEVPIAAALMEELVYNSMVVENTPERYKSLREREIERRRAAGEPLNMSYDELQEYLVVATLYVMSGRRAESRRIRKCPFDFAQGTCIMYSIPLRINNSYSLDPIKLDVCKFPLFSLLSLFLPFSRRRSGACSSCFWVNCKEMTAAITKTPPSICGHCMYSPRKM